MAPLMGQAGFPQHVAVSARSELARRSEHPAAEVKQPAIRQGGHDTPAARLHQVKTILLKRPLACVTT